MVCPGVSAGWLILDDDRVERFHMVEISTQDKGTAALRSKEFNDEAYMIAFQWADGGESNIFTPESLQQVCLIENTVSCLIRCLNLYCC